MRRSMEDDMENDYMKPIRKYFDVETAPRQPTKWLISCPKCGEMWHLAKGPASVGASLHLLNHARSHDAPKKNGKRKQAALDALNG